MRGAPTWASRFLMISLSCLQAANSAWSSKKVGAARKNRLVQSSHTGLDLLPRAVDMDLNPVAVVPDFMKSLATPGAP
jgi:hypothetical protein